jgi:hypothetical protein
VAALLKSRPTAERHWYAVAIAHMATVVNKNYITPPLHDITPTPSDKSLLTVLVISYFLSSL